MRTNIFCKKGQKKCKIFFTEKKTHRKAPDCFYSVKIYVQFKIALSQKKKKTKFHISQKLKRF